MFTGIIEGLANVKEIVKKQDNISICFTSAFTPELKVDQSVSHNGVCLTIEKIDGNCYWVTAIPETIEKTTLGLWKVGDKVNVERCLSFNGRLDGHIVQGHVDCTAVCINRIDAADNWIYSFEIPAKFAALIIEKGSISMNGTSLTIFNVTKNTFTVAIIPYTYNHTSIQAVQIDTAVNIEFDIVGKYVNRLKELSQ
jgi:riboflavin synthase